MRAASYTASAASCDEHTSTSVPMTSVCSSWDHPPETLTLASDEVHVWRAGLDRPKARVESLLHTLAPDEKARAERFHFEKDRDSFIVARVTLKRVLGRYLGLPPAKLRFSYNAYGKPALANNSGADALRFNLSHSHQLMICAVTCGRDIGIDLEHLRSDLAELQIAEQFFSSQEVAVLCALPVEQQTKAFFNCWTRKEAYTKARGEGLSFALNQFDVQLAPGESAALLRNRGDAREVSRWSLQELIPAPDYVGALAVEGHAWRLECWQWP